MGLIAVDPTSMKVVIAPRLKGTDYGHLAGTPMRLPKKAELRPNPDALKMHADWACSTWKRNIGDSL
ncbi:MAG: hypothetical protein EOO38_32375 [Cytophagaceae bacterium]|nr:MAG: hypothetical protein EOO38_32375 [Cytophagaceae bacterium]